jgi:hypothetical protein
VLHPAGDEASMLRSAMTCRLQRCRGNTSIACRTGFVCLLTFQRLQWRCQPMSLRLLATPCRLRAVTACPASVAARLTSVPLHRHRQFRTMVSVAAAEVGPQSLEEHRKRSWEFFRSIGSPALHVAPMVDQVTSCCIEAERRLTAAHSAAVLLIVDAGA